MLQTVCGFILALLITLKIVGVITLSWLQVFSPLLLYGLYCVIVIVIEEIEDKDEE